MKRVHLSWGVVTVALACICAWLAVENGGLRRELRMRTGHRGGEPVKRPRSSFQPRPPSRPRPSPKAAAVSAEPVAAPQEQRISVASDGSEAAFKRLEAELRQKRLDDIERRRERIRNLTPEEKEAQRDAFLSKMHERATQRMREFVAKTGLSADQTASFETTVSALDTSLREAAEAWAEEIRTTKSFSQDSRVRFIGDMSAILSAGYGQMDATLPVDWKSADGNVNLMELVGPEALSSVVEALTENGLEDGLQTIGSLMGGPQGGPDGGSEEGPGGMGPGGEGGEGGPGTGGGPGGMMGGPGGMMGGSGGGVAPPAAH